MVVMPYVFISFWQFTLDCADGLIERLCRPLTR